MKFNECPKCQKPGSVSETEIKQLYPMGVEKVVGQIVRTEFHCHKIAHTADCTGYKPEYIDQITKFDVVEL